MSMTWPRPRMSARIVGETSWNPAAGLTGAPLEIGNGPGDQSGHVTVSREAVASAGHDLADGFHAGHGERVLEALTVRGGQGLILVAVHQQARRRRSADMRDRAGVGHQVRELGGPAAEQPGQLHAVERARRK